MAMAGFKVFFPLTTIIIPHSQTTSDRRVATGIHLCTWGKVGVPHVDNSCGQP